MKTFLPIAFLVSIAALAQVKPLSPSNATDTQLLEYGFAAIKMQDPLAFMEENGFECDEWQIKDGDFGAGCNIDLGNGDKYFIQLRRSPSGWIVDAEDRYDPWE